jgi:hypothetical protein
MSTPYQGPIPGTWGTPPPPPNDQLELLRRIDQNTANILWWLRLTVVAVVALVLILAFVP